MGFFLMELSFFLPIFRVLFLFPLPPQLKILRLDLHMPHLDPKFFQHLALNLLWVSQFASCVRGLHFTRHYQLTIQPVLTFLNFFVPISSLIPAHLFPQ